MYAWVDKRKRSKLPIDAQLDRILSLLNKHQVLICEAETGAGKTTRIPQAALLADPNLKIFMTQPRRNACRWIGKRIALELGCKPGELVGWRLFGEDPVISQRTRLELLVDQSLINRIRDKQQLPAGLIIVDEAHERSVSIDLLLGFIKEKLKKSHNTCVLITSATIDTDKFSRFFNNAPVVKVKGRCFPVSVERFPLSRGEHHTEGAARCAIMVLERFLQHTLVIPDGANEKIVEKGTVLVLLPGKEDISSVMQELQRQVKYHRVADNIQVFSCHGESSAKEQDQVQKAVPAGTLRFVCCTELLRTSVTIPETIGVIDSLQVKRMIVNSNGIGCLDKVAISKAEADQAKGRAGRVSSGFYLPVSFEMEYDHLAKWPQPAILREPITQVILQVAAINRSVHSFDFIDAPSKEKIQTALLRLKAISAMTKEEKITENGKLLLQFPLDPELAMILLTASKLGVLAEAMIVTAVLEVEGIFHPNKCDATILVDAALLQRILGKDKTLENLPGWVSKKPEGFFEVKCGDRDFPDRQGARWVASLVRKTWAGENGSDFTAIVRAYRAFKLVEQQYKIRSKREKYLDSWCFARGLNLKKLHLAEDKLLQIQEALRTSPLKSPDDFTENRIFDEIALTKAIISGKVNYIARNNRVYGIPEFSSKLGDFQLDYTSTCTRDAQFILISHLRKIHVTSKGDTPTYRFIADHAALLEIGWLYEVAPQLCSKQPEYDSAYYDPAQDAVLVTEISYFNDHIELGRNEVVVRDNHATQPLAHWLAQQCLHGHLNTPSRNATLNEIIAHNIAQQESAKELNRRAGKAHFKVYSSEELSEFFAKVLLGVTCVSNLNPSQIESLRLPELDVDLKARVMQATPVSIRIMRRDFSVEYRGSSLLPIVRIQEDFLTENWLQLLTQRPQLPDMRHIEIEVVRKTCPNFTLRWNQRQQADLSRVDFSTIRFVKNSLVNSLYLTVESNNMLPLFLSDEVFAEERKFNQALNTLSSYMDTPSQYKFIQVSVAMQVITKSKALNSIEYLTWLENHDLMKKREPLQIVESVSSVMNSFLGFFKKSLPGIPTESGIEIEMDRKIKKAREEISHARHFQKKHIFV